MTQILGVKELYKNLNKIAQRAEKGEVFTIVKRSKPIFQLIPYKAMEKKKKYTIQDFLRLQFKGGGKISKQVDKIAYGI